MFKKVLVPLDTLRPDHPLLVAAADLFPGAQVHLLHVLLPFSPTPGNALRYAAMPEIDQAQAQLQEARQTLQTIGMGEVVLSAAPAAEVLQRASSGQFDLVMMGTSSKNTVEKRLLGSVASAAVRSSPVPVLTMGRRFPDEGHMNPRRVLVLQDFSPAVRQAIYLAKRQFPHAAFEMLHVLPHGTRAALTTPGHLSYSLLHLRRQRRIMDSEHRLDKLGGGKLSEGHPAEVALDHAATGKYDLIVMGTSSKGAVENFFFGSVAQQVVTESPIPVLTARASASEHESVVTHAN